MAASRLDPRMNADRIYQYNEYQILSAAFQRRKSRAWYQFIPPLKRFTLERRSVRYLPYKLAVLAGLFVLVSSLTALAFLDADIARLEYVEQEYQVSLSGLNQSVSETAGDNVSRENAVFTGNGGSVSEVVYPAQTRYVVLTNIPQASGKNLVEELYPLSREMVTVEP